VCAPRARISTWLSRWPRMTEGGIMRTISAQLWRARSNYGNQASLLYSCFTAFNVK
jgi:hypothetical protein